MSLFTLKAAAKKEIVALEEKVKELEAKLKALEEKLVIALDGGSAGYRPKQ